jgi:hypothetical protein
MADRCDSELFVEGESRCDRCGGVVAHDGAASWSDESPEVSVYCGSCCDDAIRATGTVEGNWPTVFAYLDTNGEPV